MVEIAKLLVAALAAISLFGGLMGFIKAKSKASLIAGSVSAVLLGLSYAVSNFQPTYGLIGGLFVAGLLEAHFLKSYLKSKKPMPAVPMIICSGITSIVIVIALLTGH